MTTTATMTITSTDAPPQLKNPDTSRYAWTTTRLRLDGANTRAAPKSAKAIAKISNAEEAIPGSARGKVAVKKLTHPFAPRLFEAFSIEPSAKIGRAHV